MNTVEADGMSSRDQNEVRAATDKLRIVVDGDSCAGLRATPALTQAS
jgi:hypothetical protein